MRGLAGLLLLAAAVAAGPARPHGDAPHPGDGGGAGAGAVAEAGAARTDAAGSSADAAGAGAFAVPAPGSYALPPLGDAADGALLGRDGAPVRLADLFGPDAVLLSFVYTRCSDGDGCPLATAVLHGVGSRLARRPEWAARVRLISVSFDPARDTPDVMRRYGEPFRRDGLDWRFLTARDETTLAPILAAYRQTRVAERDEAGRETGRYAHLLRVFLIDGSRRIRQVYSTSLLDPDALLADVETILIEAEALAGGVAGAEAGAGARAPAGSVGAGAVPASASAGAGDDRTGYDRVDFATRSRALAERRGRGIDLLAHARSPSLGLPAVPVPADNPLTAAKVALGRRLFFDRRLSANDTLSCAMCHVPEQGFTSNELATSVGIEGRSVRRNAPTILNVAFAAPLFHDGRAASLEAQIEGPLLARNEMGNASMAAVVEKVRGLDDYAARFAAAFPGRSLDEGTLARAIASYERTLVAGDAPFDRFAYGGEADALSPAARRGLALFTGAAGCAACHTIGAETALFSDGRFHATGAGAPVEASADAAAGEATLRVQAAPGVWLDVPRRIVARVSAPPAADLGREEVTGDPADRRRYRTPSLRNVALTAPYMHDGSLATLADVVAFYRRGGGAVGPEGVKGGVKGGVEGGAADGSEGGAAGGAKGGAGGGADPGGIPDAGAARDPLIRPLALSDADAADLVAFLESLTSPDVARLVADAFAAPVGDVRDDAAEARAESGREGEETFEASGASAANAAAPRPTPAGAPPPPVVLDADRSSGDPVPVETGYFKMRAKCEGPRTATATPTIVPAAARRCPADGQGVMHGAAGRGVAGVWTDGFAGARPARVAR